MSFSALYDLRTRITTYDYFTWQAHVQALGASEIVFQAEHIVSTKWGLKEARKRFDNYIFPGPALSVLPCRLGSDGDPGGSHMLQDLVALNRPFRRMVSVLPPANKPYTVTLRQTFHNPQKNSDEFLWRRFAERIGAHVIEDYAVEPISLYDRMALYAGAKMNFGVTNGPIGLLYLTEYPFTMFCDPATSMKSMHGHNIMLGSQLPTAVGKQKLVWERATIDNMMAEFEKIGD